MTLREYHSHNSNMSCHNLCTTTPLPNNHAMLLGLGGKFCIQTRRLSYNDLQNTISRFRYVVRVKNYVMQHVGISDEPPPKLYFKKSNNYIPEAPPIIENAISKFEKALTRVFNSRNKKYGTNITKLQENILYYFRNHPEYIILLTDKNLGPCVMNRADYIKQVLLQHLSDASSYERISEDVAREYIRESMNEFFDFIKQPGCHVPKSDFKYLKDGCNEYEHGILIFYCLPKVHKNKIPIPL